MRFDLHYHVHYTYIQIYIYLTPLCLTFLNYQFFGRRKGAKPKRVKGKVRLHGLAARAKNRVLVVYMSGYMFEFRIECFENLSMIKKNHLRCVQVIEKSIFKLIETKKNKNIAKITCFKSPKAV